MKMAQCPRCGIRTSGGRGTYRPCQDCRDVDPEFCANWPTERQLRRMKQQLQKAS